MKYLPNDVAKCNGVGEEEDGIMYWRDGCERCARRLYPVHWEYAYYLEPPTIIDFECDYLIEV